MDARPLVVVTVGTDHHRFDRLVSWMDDWAAIHPGVRCVVQHGSSRTPARAEGLEIVPRTALLELMAGAVAVVTQAGPGSVLDARSVGLVPIIVPRLSALDEVVDDHQVAFARAMADRGDAVLAADRDGVIRQVEAALADPDSLRRPPASSPAPQTAAAVEDVLATVVARPAGRIALGRVRESWLPARFSRRT